MAPDVKSLSWRHNSAHNITISHNRSSTRRKLADTFDKENNLQRAVVKKSPLKEMKHRQLTLSKFRLPRASPTRRALRSGAEKIARTFQQFRLSVDAISQRLKSPTRRRCRFENVDTPVVTPRSRSQRILGRTPTRLYSPFGIDTPNVCHAARADPNSPRWSYSPPNGHHEQLTLVTEDKE